MTPVGLTTLALRATRRITSYNVCYTKLLREAARIKHGSEVSVMQNLANNVDDLMEKVMTEMAFFEGLDGDITFETNKSYNFV